MEAAGGKDVETCWLFTPTFVCACVRAYVCVPASKHAQNGVGRVGHPFRLCDKEFGRRIPPALLVHVGSYRGEQTLSSAAEGHVTSVTPFQSTTPLGRPGDAVLCQILGKN